MPASFTKSWVVKSEPFTSTSRLAAWTICWARCRLRSRDRCTLGERSAARSAHEEAAAAGSSSFTSGMTASPSPRLDEPPAVDFGGLAARDGVDEFDGLGHLV